MLVLSTEAGRGDCNDLPESEMEAPIVPRFQLIKSTAICCLRQREIGPAENMPFSIWISFKNLIRCESAGCHLLSFYFWKWAVLFLVSLVRAIKVSFPQQTFRGETC